VGQMEEERDRRWNRAREFLEKNQLDVLVLTKSPSVVGEPLDQYLSNWIPGNVVIFPLKGEPTLLVNMIPEIMALRPDTPEGERPWMQDVRLGGRGASIVSVFKEKGLERSRAGVVGLGNYATDWEGWITFKNWDRVIKGLPNCTFQDVASSYAEWILVKSKGELTEVRRAARILEEACADMVKAVGPGVTELEVYAAIQNVLSRSRIYSPVMMLRSGPDNVSWGQPAWLFGVGSPRKLAPGDIIQAEIFGWSGGLEAQAQMAVAIPPVSSENAECAQLAAQAYKEGIRNLTPGKKFSEVVAAMEAVLDRPNVWHQTPLIHSMNPMACIGPTGVRIESLSGVEAYGQVGMGRIRGGDVALEPGMVFELELNPCIGRHRINIGGTAIVTEHDAEPLNELPTRMRLAGEG
jgi:Xaa-Pro dipeptidase